MSSRTNGNFSHTPAAWCAKKQWCAKTMRGLIAPRKRSKWYSLSTGLTPGPTQHVVARVNISCLPTSIVPTAKQPAVYEMTKWADIYFEQPGLSKRLRWSPKSGGLGHCIGERINWLRSEHSGIHILPEISSGEKRSYPTAMWGGSVQSALHEELCSAHAKIGENMLARSIIAPFASLAGPELFWYYLLLLFRLCWFIDLVLVQFYGNIINEWKCYIANRCGALIQKKKIMKIWCLQLMLAFFEKWHCRKYNANEQMLLLIVHIYQAPKFAQK